jgi:hypothetical protein
MYLASNADLTNKYLSCMIIIFGRIISLVEAKFCPHRVRHISSIRLSSLWLIQISLSQCPNRLRICISSFYLYLRIEFKIIHLCPDSIHIDFEFICRLAHGVGALDEAEGNQAWLGTSSHNFGENSSLSARHPSMASRSSVTSDACGILFNSLQIAGFCV